MQIYNYKKKYRAGLTVAFGIASVIGIYLAISGQIIGILLSIASIILAYAFYKAKVEIITNDNYIKKVIFNNEEECYWQWIYAITTERSNITGHYSTVIYWSKLDQNQLDEYLSVSNKCNENVGKMIITSHISGYEQLLKEIVSHKNDASLDQTTIKLVKE
jgi:hypothetical protein